MASSFGDASPGAKPSPGAYTPESLPSSDPPASASPEQCKVIEENRSRRLHLAHARDRAGEGEALVLACEERVDGEALARVGAHVAGLPCHGEGVGREADGVELVFIKELWTGM